MHEYLAPATLLIAILAGIWLNRRDYSTLKDDMDHRFDEVGRQFAEVNRRLGLIEADQKQFYTVTGRLDGRLDELSKR
jgi:hypothetical protein